MGPDTQAWGPGSQTTRQGARAHGWRLFPTMTEPRVQGLLRTGVGGAVIVAEVAGCVGGQLSGQHEWP